jgi:hypothetical protein
VPPRTLGTPKACHFVTDSFSVLIPPCCSNSGSARRRCHRRFLPRARRPCCFAECSAPVVPSRAHTADLPIGERGGWRARNRINMHYSRPRTGSLDLRGASKMQNCQRRLKIPYSAARKFLSPGQVVVSTRNRNVLFSRLVQISTWDRRRRALW